MAVTDEKDGALATAAVAAAAGVGAYALRKALTSGSATSLVPARNGQGDGEDDGDEGGGDEGGSRGGSSLLSTVLDSASSSLVPLAEEAAEAAGKWTAENAPDVVRDRIVPRFIESFNDAA
jgi:hypothetical protein